MLALATYSERVLILEVYNSGVNLWFVIYKLFSFFLVDDAFFQLKIRKFERIFKTFT